MFWVMRSQVDRSKQRSRHMYDPITQVRCSLGYMRPNTYSGANENCTQGHICVLQSHCFNGGTIHHIFILLLLYYIVVLRALLPLLDKNGYTSVCDKWKYCRDTLEPSSETRCGLIHRAVNCDEISRDTSGFISYLRASRVIQSEVVRAKSTTFEGGLDHIHLIVTTQTWPRPRMKDCRVYVTLLLLSLSFEGLASNKKITNSIHTI